MFVINIIPVCHFRASEEAEIVGMDEAECGECELSLSSLVCGRSSPLTQKDTLGAYDYASVRRHVEDGMGVSHYGHGHDHKQPDVEMKEPQVGSKVSAQDDIVSVETPSDEIMLEKV